ncbi:MAG: hypothetical protein HZY76_11210 [Anaerolineae bacterium]|nr:MAG: hypothetical protein HZY76_11210 [Anaerolineae bacterium]
MADDVLAVHHLDGNHRNNRYSNWALLHGHCHGQAHSTRAVDNGQCAEEPDAPKCLP